MFDSAAPDQTQLDHQLPANAYWHLIRTLRLALPPPPGENPGPDDFLRRDHAAIACIAGLAPGNAPEARLAAQFVAASEQWNDCLRLAQAPDATPESAAKCRAQALNLMRQANSALRLLQRMQKERRELEADNVLRDRLARTEHVATRQMAEALSSPPTPAPAPCADTVPANPAPEPRSPAPDASPEPDFPRRKPGPTAPSAEPCAPAFAGETATAAGSSQEAIRRLENNEMRRQRDSYDPARSGAG